MWKSDDVAGMPRFKHS
jgi:hypothetical protein